MFVTSLPAIKSQQAALSAAQSKEPQGTTEGTDGKTTNDQAAPTSTATEVGQPVANEAARQEQVEQNGKTWVCDIRPTVGCAHSYVV